MKHLSPPLAVQFDLLLEQHKEPRIELPFLPNLDRPPAGADRQLNLRCLFRIRRKAVRDFVIQVEVNGVTADDTAWHPVIRYDCAHGFLHRDLISSDGRKIKEELPTQKPSEAIELAIQEIHSHLKVWLQELGYDQVDSRLLEEHLIVDDLEKNKQILLTLLADPSALNSTQSRAALFPRKVN